MSLSVVLLLVALTAAPAVSGARILCLYPFASRSHTHVFNALTTELARRGHDVTVVTPYPVTTPPDNYRQLDMPQVRATLDGLDMIHKSNRSYIGQMWQSWDLMGLCSKALEMPQVQNLLNERFDLVINSVIFNECTIPFAYHNKAPLVMISPSASLIWSTESMGNPEPYSYVPNIILPFSDHMNFGERMINAATGTLLQYVMRSLFQFPRMNAAAREFFGENIPSVQELERNASLALLNNHVSLNYPRPLLPSVVEVGGMHVEQNPAPLPQDIQDFLDGATEGAIYFSLGSIIRSDHLHPDIVHSIVEVFSQLPQRVLWKWDLETLPGQPANVKLGKWLPQQAILAHPNVLVFITQGGLMSTQEAAYHGVPLLGLPVLGDQRLNMHRYERLGFALSLELNSLDSDTFRAAIQRMLHTPSYTDVAKTLMKRVRDQPETPLDRAVFWTEYVLRHKGAPHLRSAATHLAWYQLYLLDVAAAILLTLLLLVLLLSKLLRLCCCGSSSSPKSMSSQDIKKKN